MWAYDICASIVGDYLSVAAQIIQINKCLMGGVFFAARWCS